MTLSNDDSDTHGYLSVVKAYVKRISVAILGYCRNMTDSVDVKH